MPPTVASLLAAAIARDPARPLITFYDDWTGERVELSGTTLDNWVSKTANLLVDGVGAGVGGHARVALPPHWQTAAVLLGCWVAGVAVSRDPAPDVAFVESRTPTDGDGAGEVFTLGFAPMAMPSREVPPGTTDYVAEVRGHGDTFRPYVPVEPGTTATDDATAGLLTHEELCRYATTRAAHLGIGPDDRVLVDGDTRVFAGDWLLTPLFAGASLVLTRHTEPSRTDSRRTTERITTTLG